MKETDTAIGVIVSMVFKWFDNEILSFLKFFSLNVFSVS